MASRFGKFWSRWTGPDPHYTRFSKDWWIHHSIVFTVFGITGSSAMYLVRPVLTQHLMGIEPGTALTGSQRALSLVYMLPFYYAILLVVGTAFGKYQYVKAMVYRPVTKISSLFSGKKVQVAKEKQ